MRLVVLSAAVFVLLMSATAAQAKEARLYSASFTAGYMANPYAVTNPWSVAVDSTSGPSSGDVYVSDPTNHLVEKLNGSGEFLLMFGKEVNKTKVEAAAPEAEQNVCTATSGDECQAGSAGSTPGAFGSSQFLYVAVDNSAGPSAGDVYVGDSSRFGSGGDDMVSKYDSSGQLIVSWGAGGQIDGSSDPNGPIHRLSGLAVDASGTMWAMGTSPDTRPGFSQENPLVFKFSPASTFIGDWRGLIGDPGTSGIALDPTGNAYIEEENGDTIFKYVADGTELGEVDEQAVAPDAFGVDQKTADLYVEGRVGDVLSGSREVLRYTQSCRPAGFFEPCSIAESFQSSHLGRASSLAIDSGSPKDTLYIAQPGQVIAFSLETVPDVSVSALSAVTGASATLNGRVNPGGVELLPGTEGCRFEWGVEEAPFEHIVPCDKSAAEIGHGHSPVAVHADISGLAPGQTYHFRLVAANANQVNELIDEPSESQTLTFGPPRIVSGFSRDVSANVATVGATIDANDVDTQFHIVYGPEGGEELATPSTAAGSGAGDHLQELDGLLPGTRYLYRVVAENALGVVEGEELSFTTQAPAPFSLLDGRGWEMVSPPEKRGALFKPIGEAGVVQVAADGGAISYLASNPTEADPQGFTNQVQVLSARGSSGWASRDLALPNLAPTGLSIGVGQEYRFFSEDLSQSIVQPFLHADLARISPLATEVTPFLRSDFPAGSPTDFCEANCYRPVVTGAEGVADVPPGTEFGADPSCRGLCGPLFVDATQSGDNVLLESQVGLTKVQGDEGGLYEWSSEAPPTEALQLVSILPNGKPVRPGGVTFLSDTARNAISSNGTRVIWNAGSHLYLRDLQKAETIQIDRVQPGATGKGVVEPVFQGASSDGSRVLFTDQQVLVHGAGAAHGEPDLYECHIQEVEGQLHCSLTDLTPVTAGEHASVQGLVLGFSDDASSAYFVADGVLAGNTGADGSHASRGHCEPGEDSPGSTCNLYVSLDGSLSFIATLSGEDGPSWGDGVGGLPGLTARVSPNGEWLAFMSQRSLTGYDNHDAATGEPDEEVFLFHAPGSGSLVCASCNPTGARPHGVEFAKIDASTGHLAGGDRVWPATTRLAASIPGWTPYRTGRALHQPRYLSNDGRLFFTAADSLAPKDSNGTEDVYEYEAPAGETATSDSCSEASATFSPAAGGCIDLVSSGTSGEESALLDASESGDDVFFLSASQLAPRDEDGAVDVYDARVGGGEPQPVQPVQCEGDGCQQPVSPPLDQTPGSLTFHGAGNVHEKAPGKKKHKKRKRHHKKRAHAKRQGSSKRGGNR